MNLQVSSSGPLTYTVVSSANVIILDDRHNLGNHSHKLKFIVLMISVPHFESLSNSRKMILNSKY